tara:strand:- start:1757 stop:1996 length:240 start_codon:yes stop_codon:yes gene_type:complete
MSFFSDVDDVEELIGVRKKLRDALFRGLNSVNYNGEMVSFSHPDLIRKSISELTQEINKRSGANKPASIIYITAPSRGI